MCIKLVSTDWHGMVHYPKRLSAMILYFCFVHIAASFSTLFAGGRKKRDPANEVGSLTERGGSRVGELYLVSGHIYIKRN